MDIVEIAVKELKPYEKNANYFVYKHTFPNGKVYIGITSQKYITHRWQSGKGYKNQEMMYNAILKYGWDNIKHEILFENLTQEEAFEKEKYLIKAYRSDERKYGYNIRHGGDANKNYKLSEETRKKMSKARTGTKNHMFGKHMTEEVRQKLSASHKGKCNIEAIRRGVPKRSGRNAYNARKVVQLTIDGDFIKLFYSLSEARNETGIRSQDIYNCCIGRQKSAYGYKWRYYE